MRYRIRTMLLAVLLVFHVSPALTSGVPQELVNQLVNAIPRDMIPENYGNEGQPITRHSENSCDTVVVRFGGPRSAAISFELKHYPVFPQPIGELVKIHYRNKRPDQILKRSLDFGEAGCHTQTISDLQAFRDLRLDSGQTVLVGWGKYILEVSISGHQRPKLVSYGQYEVIRDFTEQEAGALILKLARATFDRIGGEPDLSRISVEQRHLTYDTAKITVKAVATYPMIGQYDGDEISFTVYITGPDNQKHTFNANAPQVRRTGEDLHLEWSFETRTPGKYGAKVVLLDKRQDSGASNERFTFGLERKLSVDFNITRPVAEIMVVNRNVTVMRHEHSTVAGGVIVTSEKKYHQPKDINWLRTIAEMLGQDTTTPGEYEATRIWEPVEQETSHFVYTGDRIGLWGYPDPSFQRPTELNDVEGFLLWLRNGSSSVVLEWENGPKGEAIWNPNKANYNRANGASFIVGASQGSSGRWKQTWREWFGTTSKALMEQGVQGVAEDARDAGINWFLNMDTTLFFSVFGIFSLSTGNTVYDDLVYLQLESKVFLSSRKGELSVFTFEGSPKIVYGAQGRKVTVMPGKMATVKSGAVSEPRTFTTADLMETQRPVGDVNVEHIRQRKDKQKEDIPQLNADIVRFGFFEGPADRPSSGERTFTNTFEAGKTRYVYWHLELRYPRRSSDLDFSMLAVWYRPDGQVMGRTNETYRMKSGWTGSYHDSKWGAAESGSWKPGDYRMELYLDGEIIARGSFTVTGSTKADGKIIDTMKPVYDFSTWPMEYKLDVAINRAETTLKKSLTREMGQRLERVLRLVQQAKQAYMTYHGSDYTIYRGSTEPSDCPHNLQKVLEICVFDMEQIEGSWARSPRPPSMNQAEAKRLTDAIEKAVHLIRQAYQEAEQSGGWNRFTDENGISFQAPPEFKILKTDDFPFAVQARDTQDRPDRVVLVRKREKPAEMSVQAFQEDLISEQRNKFKDFHDLQAWRQFPGLPGYWFTFRYTWDGRPIQALFYQDPNAEVPLEIRYIGVEGSFSMTEGEAIIRSVRTGK